MISASPSTVDGPSIHHIEWFAADFSSWSKEFQPFAKKDSLILNDSFLKHSFERVFQSSENLLDTLSKAPFDTFNQGIEASEQMISILGQILESINEAEIKSIFEAEYNRVAHLIEEFDEIKEDYKTSINLREDKELIALMRSI